MPSREGSSNKTVYLHSFIVNMCQLPVEPGPCRVGITREVTSTSLDRSLECTSYLKDVLKNCPFQNTTFALDECQKICGKFFSSIQEGQKIEVRAIGQALRTAIQPYMAQTLAIDIF